MHSHASFILFSIRQNADFFDISHAFLPSAVAKLSTLKNSLAVLAQPVCIFQLLLLQNQINVFFLLHLIICYGCKQHISCQSTSCQMSVTNITSINWREIISSSDTWDRLTITSNMTISKRNFTIQKTSKRLLQNYEKQKSNSNYIYVSRASPSSCSVVLRDNSMADSMLESTAKWVS